MAKLAPPDLSLIDRQPWTCEGRTYLTAMSVIHKLIQDPSDVDRPPIDDSGLVKVEDGIHYVPVRGILLPYENLFSLMYGATTLDVLQQQLNLAATNPTCKAVVLAVDSPGGSATGVAELADWLYQLRDLKPVYAMCRRALSGAYWLAAACQAVVATESTAEFGSIGAVIEARDATGQAKLTGETIHVFSSGKLKVAGHPYTRMTDEDMRYLQGKVLDLGLQFFDALRAYRPDLFGPSEDPDGDPRAVQLADGATFYAGDAQEMGLIDGVRSPVQLHSLITS